MDTNDYQDIICLFATACESIEPRSFDNIIKALSEPCDWVNWAIAQWPEDAVTPIKRAGKQINNGRFIAARRGYKVKAIRQTISIKPIAIPFFKKMIADSKVLTSRGLTYAQAEQLFRQEVKVLINELVQDQKDVLIWYKIIQPVTKYESAIKEDIEYTEEIGNVYKEAIVNRLMLLVMDVLSLKPDSPNWLVGKNGMRPETMARIFGIKFLAKSKRNVENTVMYVSAVADYAGKILHNNPVALSEVRLSCCHLLARLIAQERGYDRGQSDKAIGEAVIEGLIHKPVISHDEDTTEEHIDVKDASWKKELDDVENKLILQSVMEEISDPTDKLAILVYREAQRTSLQEAYQQFSTLCHEHGLNGSNSISQRITRLTNVYPQLSKYNPFPSH